MPADAEALLRSLQPVVRFDSHEAFFAHDVSAMADSASFRLTRTDSHAAQPGYVIATHASGLDTAFLRSGSYPNGAQFADGDHLSLDLGGPDPFADKIGDYRQMERHLNKDVRDVVYGRAVGADGHSVSSLAGEVWLQFWYFYIYNDAQFGGRIDLHEGDWEMVQFLARDGEPVTAVFAQHAYAESKPFDQVYTDPDDRCPIVFSGRGSHASYFEPGLQRTHVRVGGDYIPLWWDAADGNGPRIRQRLVVLDDDSLPGWASWAGAWGGTRPHLPLIDGESPGGPITHEQWKNPGSLTAKAITHEKRQPADAPAVAVRRARSGLRVRFDFTEAPVAADRLVLTARAEGHPPITETIVVDTLARGHFVTRDVLDPQASYVLDVSTISATGVPTAPPARPIKLGPARPLSPLRAVAAVLHVWDRLLLRLGTRLARRLHRPPPGG